MNKLRMKPVLSALIPAAILVCISFRLPAQVADTTLVQFSGVVVTADSLMPIPFVSINVDGTYRGTLSDFNGFFSIVARKKEIIVFSSLGYKPVTYSIPDTLSKDRYSLIQLMRPDTLYLNETVIYPWPTYEQFKEAFVKADIPDDEIERARKNIAIIERRVLTDWVPMDGSMNYRNLAEQRQMKRYYFGQLPPNNLLNPFAWARFFKAWKDGQFKTERRE